MVLDVPATDLWFGLLAGATEEELAANPAASPTSFIHLGTVIGALSNFSLAAQGSWAIVSS